MARVKTWSVTWGGVTVRAIVGKVDWTCLAMLCVRDIDGEQCVYVCVGVEMRKLSEKWIDDGGEMK